MLGVWVRTYKAFCLYPTGPIAYFALITTPEKTATQVGQVGGVILGDAMMVYRTFVIWGLNYYVIILPSLTLIATIVSAVGFITVQHQVSVTTSIFAKTVTQWTEAWLGSSLATTGICTILIVYKLTKIIRNMDKANVFQDTLSLTRRVTRIFVESAAMYSINNLLYSVLYALKQQPESWFSSMDAVCASITFSLIIIRVESVVNRPPTSRSFRFADSVKKNKKPSAKTWNSADTVESHQLSLSPSSSIRFGEPKYEKDKVNMKTNVIDVRSEIV